MIGHIFDQMLNVMKIFFVMIFTFALAGCTTPDVLKVREYKTVTGDEAAPWQSACLVTAESRTQQIIGLYGLSCAHIEIGDTAVFNHKGDTVFWVNDIPYNVKQAQSR